MSHEYLSQEQAEKILKNNFSNWIFKPFIYQGYRKTRVDYICENGHEGNANFANLQQNKGCMKCRIIKNANRCRKSYENAIKQLYKKRPNWIFDPFEYKNVQTRIYYTCDKGHKHHATFLNIIKGRGCPFCSKYKIRRNQEQAELYVQSLRPTWIFDPFIYKGAFTRVYYTCEKGHKHSATINNLGRYGCPYCNESIGERIIETILKDKSIKYIRQYRFENCCSKRKLPFDFYLPDYNTCIEYDGELHFKCVKYFGGIKAFRKTKMRDKIKTNYCKNNNIKLVRINYKQRNNISNILNNIL
ncbi:MAG: hypothetical protein WC433_08215 [Candidatus Omnitrophota bacterium]|jgi:hypothetical protein